MRKTVSFPFELKRPKTTVLRVLRSIIAAGVLVEIVLLSHTPSASHTLIAATSQQPETYTELSFVRAGKLPAELKPGTVYHATYRITNHEAGPMAYQASITLVENGRPRLLRMDSPVIAQGASQNFTVPFSAARPDTTIQIIIDLPAHHQSIHFESQS
jgi:hypothetical protein